jgi:primosomal protein N' (replication factor Y)
MALLLFRGRDEGAVARTAGGCAEFLRGQALPGVDVMGPVAAPLSRIRGSYRWQVVLKTISPSKLNALARQALEQFGSGSRGRRGGVFLDVDVDPVSLL